MWLRIILSWKLYAFIVWYYVLKIATNYELGIAYVSISGLIFIFTNTGKRKEGTLSAYSVFNEGYEELMGTFNMR